MLGAFPSTWQPDPCVPRSCFPSVNVIKLFSPQLTNGKKKLEHLSLASPSSLVKCLLVRPVTYTPGAVFTTLNFLRNLRIGPISYSVTLQ
jgi:hypothetical protein